METRQLQPPYEDSSTTADRAVGIFPTRLGSLAPDIRRPLLGAVLLPSHHPYCRLLLLRAGDVERNPGPTPPCVVCGGHTTSTTLLCSICHIPTHNRCSGLSRTVVERQRQNGSFKCPKCIQSPPVESCRKCGRQFRLNQSKLLCGMCNLPSHLQCSELSRHERESVKRGITSFICCSRATPNNSTDDTSTAPSAAPVIAATTEPKSSCARCMLTIRKNAPRVTCSTCGQTYHLICTRLPRTQRQELRDGNRNWACCDSNI